MPYTINKFSGEPLVVLEDGTIDTSTSLGLVGRNYVGYGETQNENFLFLLENFAHASPPSRPLQGQTWFDSEANLLNVYDGAKWVVVGSAVLSDTPPVGSSNGALWLKTPINTLHVWNGTEWEFVGPETAEGFGITRARSVTLPDGDNVDHPVILFTVDDEVLAIASKDAFTIRPDAGFLGFSNLISGITLSTLKTIKGSLTGNADTATRLQVTRTINGIGFNGTEDITIKSSTTNKLNKGSYITGTDFDGSTSTTWAVDASSANISGKVVARNSFGGFAATTVTADLIGNVTAPSGTSTFDVVTANSFVGATLSGNAETATRLRTTRTINGVPFDGSANITVPASGATLTGPWLAPNILGSNLQNVGLLESLDVADTGIQIGGALSLYTDVGIGIRAQSTLDINVVDENQPGGFLSLRLMPGAESLSLGGDNTSTISQNTAGLVNLGHPSKLWNKVYATSFIGNASTATLATTATNIAGGGAGSIPYQTSIGTTSLLPIGTPGYVLRAGAGNSLQWEPLQQERLTAGDYISYLLTGGGSSLTYYDAQQPVTISVDATPTNTASKIVARDSSGNFSAGTITASLAGNANTASALQTPRNINGVAFDGTANITVPAVDPTKLPLTGGTMTGAITLPGAPTAANHATTKSYVDTRIPTYTFTYGAIQAGSRSNIVGYWSDSANYFDVFPPSGKSMSDLVAFIPSLKRVWFAGGVDSNDALRTDYQVQGDRIRVWVQNTEQNRDNPWGNYLAVWS